MKLFTRKYVLRMVLILAGIYLAGGILLYLFQDGLLFHPKPLSRDYRFSFSHPFEEVNLPVGDRNVNIIRFHPPKEERGVVLYFHGNMENVERYAGLAPLFTSQGYSVWMIDYP